MNKKETSSECTVSEDTRQTREPLSLYTMCKLEKNSVHNVYVCYTSNGPQEFWIRLERHQPILRQLNYKLNKSNLRPLNVPPTIGTACLGKHDENGSLCRCVVIDTDQENCAVLFVDYGNISFFCFNDLYDIPDKYIQYKVMAMRCALADLPEFHLTYEAIHAFRTFFNNNLLKMTVIEEGTSKNLPLCSLSDSNNINAINVIKSTLMLEYFPYTIPDISSNVVVKYVHDCSKFYVQQKSREKELYEVCAMLEKNCLTSLKNSLLQEGLPCCAISPIDNKWNRAKVLSKENDVVRISYVDYGNEDMVKIEDLKVPTTNHLTTISPLAVECSLSEYDDEKDRVTSKMLQNLISGKEFKLEIIDWKGTVPVVELLNDRGVRVTTLLERLWGSVSLDPPSSYEDELDWR
ncbi:hypothetical protein RI129_012028 [Pyrocoelia pectoralis]|uniref:Tudor domain-containing protein n=1 Tax=Pyrocoelia pectoralis TaxID=417401 RepID=A0AAN7V5Z1_9COLE